ncbi:hypothetical protein [Paraburkholderia sp. BCC1884]|uniref:hypothetical protein n=1 Tax=Paraburkholderia sp. BCC1884 TaxID=2562668 RepID=UPI0011826B29|nr:hypothetical protein [Paraburkholderia sp. BCC1884]
MKNLQENGFDRQALTRHASHLSATQNASPYLTTRPTATRTEPSDSDVSRKRWLVSKERVYPMRMIIRLTNAPLSTISSIVIASRSIWRSNTDGVPNAAIESLQCCAPPAQGELMRSGSGRMVEQLANLVTLNSSEDSSCTYVHRKGNVVSAASASTARLYQSERSRFFKFKRKY